MEMMSRIKEQVWSRLPPLAKLTLRDRERLRQEWRAPAIFIHINKTAGTSIKDALGLPRHHWSATEYEAEIGRVLYRRRPKFSFVRNPWDRAVSHYAYRVKTDQTGLGDGHLSFDGWIRAVYLDRDPTYVDRPQMFRTQVDWLKSSDGTIDIDFVGRFESMQADFVELCRRLRVAPVELPHSNVSRLDADSYRDRFDDETAEIIRQYFGDDIERFGYEF
jgi:chondroitin 4-sulfotransferase 11